MAPATLIMNTFKTLTPEQYRAILHLWNNEYPAQLRHPSITELHIWLEGLIDAYHMFATEEDGQITGWCTTFTREGKRWFAMIIHHKAQGTGIGTKFLDKAKERDNELHGWVIDHSNDQKGDGTPYQSPLPFYLKHGFEIVPGNRMETQKISAAHIQWKKAP